MLLNSGMATKQDGTAWAPWDVFPELQPMEEEVEAEPEAIRLMIHEMALRQAARIKAREESN